MKAPQFWQKQELTTLAKILVPFSHITHCITERRLTQTGWKAPIPVLCCGNLSTGGTGKTIVALTLGKYFLQQGIQIAFLTRGYKRKSRIPTPFQVNPTHHTAQDVGDEALLLARIAPTWIGNDRALSAQKAVKGHAQLLIMDDGFQNPTLYQDFPLLIIDGAIGFGNRHLLPAGPLRQSISSGLKKAKACILIGEDRTNCLRFIPASIPVLRTFLTMDATIQQFREKPVIAFTGIGRPEKFFQSLRNHDLNVIKTFPFPDHHFYRKKDIQRLLTLKNQYHASLVTTYKDYVKLPDDFKKQVTAFDVILEWHNPEILHALFKGVPLNQ